MHQALAPHRVNITRALEALDSGLAALINALAHGGAHCQLIENSGPESLRIACEAYSAINYGVKDPTPSSVVCIGAVGASTEIVRRAVAVNALKAELKALCAPLYGLRIRVPVKGEKSPTRAISAVRVILRIIQRSDINLLAAYRKIPVLDAPPNSITFTHARTRAVYKKTVEELYSLLEGADGPAASADRARLATLTPREVHLALVKEHYQNVRANVVYARLDARGRGRAQLPAELPVLYASGRHQPPEINFPPGPDLVSPRQAREAQLETAPFLQSLPVYRYRMRAKRV